MSDTVWVLTHPTRAMTKLWKADGSISNNEEGKLFTGQEYIVKNLRHLSKLLKKLEHNRKSCVIRGEYRGEAYSRDVEPEETKKNKVLRRMSVHKDVPHHWMLLDIDKYQPFDFDPMVDPVDSINEFITTYLPEDFHGVSYHWQLSSSFGHPSKDPSRLRAHVWFWLKTAYTSAQLRAWARATDYKGDKSLFNPIQLHYTAAPVIEKGQVSPIKVRSGFYEGDWGDIVPLKISAELLESAANDNVAQSRSQKMREASNGDPVVTLLFDKKMVKSRRNDGGLNVICPRVKEHSGDSTESATIYYPAFTGGYKQGAFKCLHDHCSGVPQSIFLDALGYVEQLDSPFEDLGDDEEDELERKQRKIPSAKFLCTDQANANRIIDAFRDKMMNVADRWYTWDGKRWRADDADATIKGMNLSKMIQKEADRWKTKKAKSTDERDKYKKIAESLEKWAKRSEMQATINAALNMTKKVLAVDSRIVDNQPWLLNVRNGTVDLRTGKLREHDSNDLITRIIDIDYDPKAKCPIWKKTLRMINREENEEYTPVSDFMKRWFGYCLTGSTREQCFVVHYGTGSNGKSTVIEMMTQIMDEYAGVAAPDLLVSEDKSKHPTEIAHLFGKRMVTAHESGESGVLRESFIKRITGSDKMIGRFMAEDFFEWIPTHKVQLLTNYKPNIKGQDKGIWRRVLLAPYTATFGSQEEVDSGMANYVKEKDLLEKLQTEKTGILTWLIRGCAEWFATGLNPPDAVIAASKQYQAEQDRVLQFVNEVCEVRPDGVCYLTIGAHQGIYPTYHRWCKVGGMHPLSKVNFLNNLERCVPKFKKKEVLRKFDGLNRKKYLQITGLLCPEYFEI